MCDTPTAANEPRSEAEQVRFVLLGCLTKRKGLSMSLKFERFEGYCRSDHALPHNMRVGQIVVRSGISDNAKSSLRCMMKKAMGAGMVFSIADEGGKYAIRRDV